MKWANGQSTAKGSRSMGSAAPCVNKCRHQGTCCILTDVCKCVKRLLSADFLQSFRILLEYINRCAITFCSSLMLLFTYKCSRLTANFDFFTIVRCSFCSIFLHKHSHIFIVVLPNNFLFFVLFQLFSTRIPVSFFCHFCPFYGS